MVKHYTKGENTITGNRIHFFVQSGTEISFVATVVQKNTFHRYSQKFLVLLLKFAVQNTKTMLTFCIKVNEVAEHQTF